MKAFVLAVLELKNAVSTNDKLILRQQGYHKRLLIQKVSQVFFIIWLDSNPRFKTLYE